MIFEVRNGCFGYKKTVPILKNISFCVESRQVLAVLGPNGVGKTTLLRSMMGMLPWTSGGSFLDGENIRDMTLFLNPCEESYCRLGSDKAPLYVTWSAENRSQLIRIPAAVGEYRRAELRSADPMTNPYIAYTLLIYAGMYGLEHDLQLCPASDFNVYTAPAEVLDGLEKLPVSLSEAAALAEASAFIRQHLPEAVISAYCRP